MQSASIPIWVQRSEEIFFLYSYFVRINISWKKIIYPANSGTFLIKAEINFICNKWEKFKAIKYTSSNGKKERKKGEGRGGREKIIFPYLVFKEIMYFVGGGKLDS